MLYMSVGVVGAWALSDLQVIVYQYYVTMHHLKFKKCVCEWRGLKPFQIKKNGSKIKSCKF